MTAAANKSNESRLYIVAGFALALTLVMAARLGYLQAYQRDFLQDKGNYQAVHREAVNARRGIISDRFGKPLAVSTPVLTVCANPEDVLEADDLSALTDRLGVTGADFREWKASGRRTVYLRRRLPPEEAREILDLGLPGISTEKEYRRYYPAGEVTSHLVGITDVNDRGQEGLELSYDKWLAGKPGEKKVVKNLRGEIILDVELLKKFEPGQSLALSIDLRLQYLAYRELKAAVSQFKAESGSLVLLDVETGQVLAMVNQPSYNPNNRVELDLAALRNRAVTDAFEPGSTVKPFTVAVALQSGRYGKSSTIETSPGYLRVDGFTVKDPVNRGTLSLGEVITHSSQVGISKLALELNEYEVWGMFDRLGLGRTTDAGFPGESMGYLPSHRRWKDIERVVFAYGYGLMVTPLQLASAYLAIASGGVKKEVSLLAGARVESARVFSEDIADELRMMLAQVVESGTGAKAAIEGYGVAGKTGTVRKIGADGYRDTEHLAFFAGMAPLASPRLVGVVLINEPRAARSGGGAIAAPVFSRVVGGALRILNVVPTGGEAA